ncbi:RNA polymerase sigma factor [Acidimicrobiaceae bacterium AH-315-P05]|nr:RNA polymerase sigma factor [Acidimicrobiaceae bacterium AH-315-P05]
MAVRDRHRDSDREIFVRWMADHRGIIVKVVRSFTTNLADAEDLTQEIDLAVWRSIPSFRGESKPSTWIWRIAHNRATSWWRGAGSSHAVLDDVVGPSAPDRADDGLLIDRIYAAIRTLPPIDRTLVVLSLEGYRYGEIAEITGMTVTNVGARLSRARSRLSEVLEETR